MSRQQHHRQRDHFGPDDAANIEISQPVAGYPAGTDLYTVLEGVAQRASPESIRWARGNRAAAKVYAHATFR